MPDEHSDSTQSTMEPLQHGGVYVIAHALNDENVWEYMPIFISNVGEMRVVGGNMSAKFIILDGISYPTT